ncbi:hypothetical protein J437_LFUL003436, partial [Ladona fulva]
MMRDMTGPKSTAVAITPPLVKDALRIFTYPLHLLIENPIAYFPDFPRLTESTPSPPGPPQSATFLSAFGSVRFPASCRSVRGYLQRRRDSIERRIGRKIVRRRWGRRKALIISGLGMAICMFGFSAYVHFCMPTMYAALLSRIHLELVYNHTSPTEHYLHLPSAGDIPAEDPPWHTFVPLVALLFWSGFGALGFVPIPWALTAELLPSETRGVASGFLSAMAYAFAFAALMIFSSAVLAQPLSICLLVMGIFAVCGTIYVAALLPETRGVAIDGLLEKGSNWKEVRGRPSGVNYTTENDTTSDSRDLISLLISRPLRRELTPALS